jgi:hypothetical protein
MPSLSSNVLSLLSSINIHLNLMNRYNITFHIIYKYLMVKILTGVDKKHKPRNSELKNIPSI